MTTLLLRAGWRFYQHHVGQLVLALTGIALGVAVIVAVDLANGNALRAFELSNQLTTSSATHAIGGPLGTMPDETYRLVKTDLALAATAFVTGRARVDHPQGRVIDVIGIDLLADTGAWSGLPGGLANGGANFIRLLTQPGTIFLPAALATELRISAGDTLILFADNARQSMTVLGVWADTSDLRWPTSAIVTDVATAQELLGLVGHLSRIELNATPEDIAQLHKRLPKDAIVSEAGSGNRVAGQMLRAFRTNLSALSWLALVVGVLLIYATMSFSIVRRRQHFGTLRALGVTRSEIVTAVLLESVTMGVIATALGLAVGWLLSDSLINLVLDSIGSLNFSTHVLDQSLPTFPFVKAAVIGIVATSVAAAGPALAAAREQPHMALGRIFHEQRMRRHFGRAPMLGAAAIGLALAMIFAPGASLVLAFAGLFLLLAGYALMLPVTIQKLLLALQPAFGRIFGLSASFAIRGAVASLGRTAVAVTALAVAVATLVGIGVMIDSFRTSVGHWIDRSLLADFYVFEPGRSASPGFSESELDQLRNLPGVTALSTSRTITFDTEDGPVAVRIGEPGPKGYGEELISGDAAEANADMHSGKAILVAEPFATRRVLDVGDTLTLPGPNGLLSFRVAGIYRDYRTTDSATLLPYSVFRRLWYDVAPTGVGVYVDDGADAGSLRDSLESYARTRDNTRVAANGEIRAATLKIFDRTFRVTGILRILAGVVAFFGILSALLALQLERSREVATLRAVGFTRQQVRTNALAQTTLLGLVAGLLALPLGVILAGLLTGVINRRSFGWTMGFNVEPEQLLAGVALAVVAAFLAGCYPAYRLSRLGIARCLSAE